MADLSRLVECLGLTHSSSEKKDRRRPEYSNLTESSQGPGAQDTTSKAWNGKSDIQNLQLEAFDPTSQVISYPPFDLDSRLVESFRSPKAVPRHLLKSLGFLRGSVSESAPTPDQAIQENDESESWITTSLDSIQDHNEHSVAPVQARKIGFNDRRIRHTFNHSLLGSSIADISDDSSVPSFKTKESLVPSENFSCPGPVWTPPLTQNLKRPGAKPHSPVISQRPKELTFKPLKQEAASLDIFQHSKPEQQHRTPPRGSNLMIQTNREPDFHSIAPTPIDYTKLRPSTRPWIATEGSSLKIPSPKPVKAIRESKQHQHQRQNNRLTERNLRRVSQPPAQDTLAARRVEDWLEDAEAEVDEDVEDITHLQVENGSFPIWSKNAERGAIESPSVDRPQPSAARALQDISNLRQPGYLQKNSFFHDAKRKN